MDIIEAKVEAALFSRLAMKKVYIVKTDKDDRDHFLSASEDDGCLTWYENGCEKGVGFREQAKKDGKPKHKKTVEELIDGVVVKTRKPKVTELALVNEQPIEKYTESCKVKIKGEIWVVNIRGNWAIQEVLMEQCEGGLILIVKGQGFYYFPKSMWNEFEGIFNSGTYKSGKPYSQSILPKKFAKYFKPLV